MNRVDLRQRKPIVEAMQGLIFLSLGPEPVLPLPRVRLGARQYPLEGRNLHRRRSVSAVMARLPDDVANPLRRYAGLLSQAAGDLSAETLPAEFAGDSFRFRMTILLQWQSAISTSSARSVQRRIRGIGLIRMLYWPARSPSGLRAGCLEAREGHPIVSNSTCRNGRATAAIFANRRTRSPSKSPLSAHERPDHGL
jgi:hypothetical protein